MRLTLLDLNFILLVLAGMMVIINRAAGGEPNWFNWLMVVADDAAVFVDFSWCSPLQLTMQP